MSWTAILIDDRGHVEGDWGYTHNTNATANVALNSNYHPLSTFDEVFRVSPEAKASMPSWWKRLDGMSGAEGAEFLGRIIAGLEADPDRFRSMNPANSWGGYDQFLDVLREMHKASLVEWRTVWEVKG